MSREPPYGRVHLSAADHQRFADVLYGHANLYAVFMAAAVEQAQASTGIVAALFPTSWTAGKYFRPLRNRLSMLSQPAPLGRVEIQTCPVRPQPHSALCKGLAGRPDS